VQTIHPLGANLWPKFQILTVLGLCSHISAPINVKTCPLPVPNFILSVQHVALAGKKALNPFYAQQLNCSVKKRQTLLCLICGLQTAQISVLWITRSGLSCSVVSTRDKSIVSKNSSTACELIMFILSISVTLNVTCLTVASLITNLSQQR